MLGKCWKKGIKTRFLSFEFLYPLGTTWWRANVNIFFSQIAKKQKMEGVGLDNKANKTRTKRKVHHIWQDRGSGWTKILCFVTRCGKHWRTNVALPHCNLSLTIIAGLNRGLTPKKIWTVVNSTPLTTPSFLVFHSTHTHAHTQCQLLRITPSNSLFFTPTSAPHAHGALELRLISKTLSMKCAPSTCSKVNR